MQIPIAFDVEYPDDLIRQSAVAFRNHLFKRYGPWLIGACVINALGLVIALLLGAERGTTLAAVGFVVVVGPVWLIYKYLAAPSQYATRLRRDLPERGRLSMKTDSIALKAHGQESAIAWSDVKAVVETDAAFLLVISPRAFALVPRRGMPSAAHKALQARSAHKAS